MSVISDFLSGLPSYNENNFSSYPNAGTCGATKTPSVYVPTVESPSEILIVNDQTNVLLRYLYRKWAKQRCKKRNHLAKQIELSLKQRKLGGDDDFA